jgi:glycosyltransferase involved in cell wall biosynthesis
VKLALVVQRYGSDIAGGSETHCRELAERLAARHDVTVLTTCARDYVTWENAIPPGTTTAGGVTVVRFPVDRPRRVKEFADVSDDVLNGDSTEARQREWFQENGPVVPALIEHLRTQGTTYDMVLFWTFRYYPSFFGVPLVADRAVLVPTAEDDAIVQLDIVEPFFQLPAGYLFLTPEEERLVTEAAGRPLTPSAIVGMGLDPVPPRPRRAIEPPGLPRDYVLYLGRVDRNKGCHTLLEYFTDFAADGEAPTLVLAGPAKMQIPQHPRIRALGYVTDEVRDALLASAALLVVPSPFESLSIVLLEAWNQGVPALVNGHCRVLAGQVVRANGGLYYRSSAEFSETLQWLLTHPVERATLGAQGRAYIDAEYRWPTVIARVEALLGQVMAHRGR